ncbi:uncharacterized protein KY384_008071 [Bacidia gigantensis]|uniref:uncharacterized protein n=1 Tax=Bacidia gigantensis TaxID=2732470 RepID=UPI001D053F29|nr:uncharacterized protein KY384_008071 [Bacidia gigantensis]KAG8526642.1 hypothetical protein KY384_008071 [Bacidia gigantensis]
MSTGSESASPFSSSTIKQELPPPEFSIQPNFKAHGERLPAEKSMLSLIRCIGELAVSDWDEVQGILQCRSREKVGVDIRPIFVKPAVMLTKHAVWSLQQLLYWWIDDQKRTFAETNWKTFSQQTLLGIGAAVDTGVSSAFDNSSMPSNGIDSSISTNDQDTPIPHVVLSFQIYRGAPLCDALTFYSLLVDALVLMAEQPYRLPYAYNQIVDHDAKVTLEWGATSEEAAKEGKLLAGMAVEALIILADSMGEQPPKQKFLLTNASIRLKDGGAIVGRVNFVNNVDNALNIEGFPVNTTNSRGDYQVSRRGKISQP